MVLIMGGLLATSGGLSSLAEDPEGAMVAAMAGNVVLFMLLALAMAPIGFIFTIRRLHDLDWSGWLALLMLIPLVSTILFLLLILRKGSAGDNSYGPPPRPWNMLQAIVAVPLIAMIVLGILAQVVMMVVMPFL